MSFYNSAIPTSSDKNTINSIIVDYGIRDFLLNKNLVPQYPFLSTSVNGSPKIGQPVLDTMVGNGNVTQPFGLPLETEGILRMEIAVLPNLFKSTSPLNTTPINIENTTSLTVFPNSTWPNGIQQYPTGSNQNVFQYGLMGKTIDANFRKKATLKNLYANASQQYDAADWITLETAPITQQLLGYTDQFGNLNIGGPSTKAADIIGSVLNGQGIGLSNTGVVPNFDLRSSLAGRVLAGSGIINDTKLGLIGGQQLALALANNAAFNTEQRILGTLNVQDNVLSLVKNGTLAGFRPNYKITVPSSTLNRVLETGASILGFTLPKSFLSDAGSIFLSESNSANIERANSMILNTGQGQITALISNMNANLIGTTQYDNPTTTPFRSGYCPGYKDNKGNKAINPITYAFGDSDGSIYNFLVGNTVIPSISYNYSKMITQYGFTAPEDNIGAPNPYSESTIKAKTFNWGSNNGEALNSRNSPTGDGNIEPLFLAADKKKSLLAKTQELFNDVGMKTIVSAFGDISTDIIPSQIQTAVVGGGISKGSAVMGDNKFDENGLYTGDKTDATSTFCRSWTSNLRYDTVSNLVRNKGLDKVVPYRFQTNNSILDDYGFPKIAPYSTDKPDDPKKYMFSIENLAWSDQVENLLPCEVGPGDLMSGKKGRIMWFPPYNIKINETSNVSWEANQFIGRGESVYTYNNTERAGSISFSIIVDHPSYVNSFRGANGPDDHYVASFFAGCVEPSSKFSEKLTVSERSSIEAANITVPQAAVVTSPPKPPEFKVYFPNDIATFDPNYENGKCGVTPIDYNIYVSGCSIGSYPGQYTKISATTTFKTYTDNYNFGFNGIKSIIDLGTSPTYSGFTDPNFIPALNTFLLEKCPACVVHIKGYASKQGDATTNLTLAKARATSLKNYLYSSLFIGMSKAEKDKRFKDDGGAEITTVGCIKDGPIDSEKCKLDRYAIVSFVLDTSLLPTSEITAQPVIKQPDRRVISKITNRFYTECNYFDQLTDTDSFVFDKFRDKIKYFHPAFHSTTPEGLNSRLTFLQQCTRQGRTLEDLGANNLAFGTPPVCILRVGDFFNTKIIIDSIAIDYDPIVWDLNPEGIGVQPMIANVNMSFKFIGGSTLMGPINKLQNALSFNYYANAQVYDPRADYIAKTPDVSASLKGKETGLTNKESSTSISGDYVLVKGVSNMNESNSILTSTEIISNTPVIDQQAANDLATGANSPETSSVTIDDKEIISSIRLSGYKNVSINDNTLILIFNYNNLNDLPLNLNNTSPVTEYKGQIYITSSVNNQIKNNIGFVIIKSNGNGVEFTSIDGVAQSLSPNINTDWNATIPLSVGTLDIVTKALDTSGSNISIDWITGSNNKIGFSRANAK